MAWTKYGKFEEFRKELDETAKKLGRDAGINYHEWINYILKESKFYTVQKVQVNGNERYTPIGLKMVVLEFLPWTPLMAAHMIRNYAELAGVRKGLEDDLWIAFERIPRLEKGRVSESKVLSNLAYSVLLRENLGDARKRFREIGTLKFSKFTPELIETLKREGYADSSQFGKDEFREDENLKRRVGTELNFINAEIARLIT